MLLSAQVGGVLGQNAVENNYLTREELNAQVDAAVACRKGD
ncbi:TPA: VENN motif pre-toxin domain-containing protein, partial [Neisseria lactamica]